MLSHRQIYTRSATLDYLQAQVGELRTIAEASRLELITYLLGMAYIELSDTIRKDRPFAEQKKDQFTSAL